MSVRIAAVPKPVVLIAETARPVRAGSAGHRVRRSVTSNGADRGALLPALNDADAIVIRSATRMDAEALAAAPVLKVVARAGIGLDNVDVPAATARGVLVVNAPAVEHRHRRRTRGGAACSSVARMIPAADASLRAGQWKRSQFTGVELADKTVGVVGLGRIGQLFASRIAAFGTTVIAYDPYLQPARAAALGVRLVDLPTLLATADIISIHLPRTPETLGLIGAEELATRQAGRDHRQRRPRRADRRAGAGRRARRRPGRRRRDRRLRQRAAARRTARCATAPNTVLTPHLGASTAEAQDKAGTAVAAAR